MLLGRETLVAYETTHTHTLHWWTYETTLALSRIGGL